MWPFVLPFGFSNKGIVPLLHSSLNEALLPTSDRAVVSDTLDSSADNPSSLQQVRSDHGDTTCNGLLTSLLNHALQYVLPEVSEGDTDTNGSDNGAAERSDEMAPEDPSSFVDMLLDPLVERLNVENGDFVKSAIVLVLASVVLQCLYLSWGYMQELIMTTTFLPTVGAPTGHFPSAAFCVWSNRVAAVLLSSILVFLRHGFAGSFKKSPLISFCPSAVSNGMSSFCQYSSLRYVSLATTTLFKCCKIVVVMLIGKLLNGKQYDWGEYVEGIFISAGVFIFSIATRGWNNGYGMSTITGYLFLILYVLCDAFTSQWQERIYQTYGRRNVDVFQMMLGVNLFALGLTTLGIIFSDDIATIVDFLRLNPVAIKYLVITAWTSCLAQICVFFVIREFGPVVFTILITIRQMVAIFLSAIAFNHKLTIWAIIGVLVVFTTIAYQIRRNYSLARQPELIQSF